MVNTFSLSISQMDKFQSCPRAYWFSRYGSWGGWMENAPERTKEIYRLKNLTGVYLWTGNRVHEAIQDILSGFQKTGHWPEEDVVIKDFLDKLRKDYRQSANATPGSPFQKGTVRLIEHDDPYRAIDASTWKSVTDRAIFCVRGFFSSAALKEIRSAVEEEGPEAIVRKDDVLETLPIQVDARTIPVYVTIDMLLKKDNHYLVVDWKTGKPKDENHERQTALYAAFVVKKFETKPENVSFALSYLAFTPGILDKAHTDEKRIERVFGEVKDSARSILSCIDDPDEGVAREDRFKAKPSRWKCAGCEYRRVCQDAMLVS